MSENIYRKYTPMQIRELLVQKTYQDLKSSTLPIIRLNGSTIEGTNPFLKKMRITYLKLMTVLKKYFRKLVDGGAFSRTSWKIFRGY